MHVCAFFVTSSSPSPLLANRKDQLANIAIFLCALPLLVYRQAGNSTATANNQSR